MNIKRIIKVFTILALTTICIYNTPTTAMAEVTASGKFDQAADKSNSVSWKIEDGKLIIHPTSGESGKINYTPSDTYMKYWPWTKYESEITSVEIQGKIGFSGTKVNSTKSMFKYCENITTISGLNNLDTSNVTSMEEMFRGCSKLENINLSGIDTHNVTDMSKMLEECDSLVNIDLTHCNTEKVTDMSFMFNDDKNLTDITFGSDFKTNLVTSMQAMFENCHSLSRIDLSHFNTENVGDFSRMFSNCTDLKTLDLSTFK